ncbi:MAG: MerR family transcriptional regulator, partial [Acetatifactor sp.]|nr:MerR family transcriptional regulator [Acetatifactor sp.]
MKINEVEQTIGITKKNIRFYEQEGLLNPSRNLSNGYRDYSETDLERLRQIKLLRKLDIPLEEIRRL